MPVNTNDRVLILEQDEARLSLEIRYAIADVLEKYRLAFLPDLKALPGTGEQIMTDEALSVGEKRMYRTRVRICQLLEHYHEQNLDGKFLVALEAYLQQTDGKCAVPYVNNPVVAEETRFAQSTSPSDPVRFPARMIFIALVKKRVLLVPLFDVQTYLPDRFGPEGSGHLLDLLPRPVRELLAALRPQLKSMPTIDWSQTTGSMATGKMSDVGGDYEDWKPEKATPPLPGFALSVGLATTWHDIADVTNSEIEAMYARGALQGSGNRAIKLYLNCLYLCRESDVARNQFFAAVEKAPYYRIYTPEFKIWVKREVTRRMGAKKQEAKLHKDRHKVFSSKLGPLFRAYVQGKSDDTAFVKLLRTIKSRILIMAFDEWPENGPIPEEYGFDWQGKMDQWKAAFALFKENKGYEDESGSISSFTAFFLYLGVYLPAWFLRNPDSGLAFPEHIPDFKGSIYIYRPGSLSLPDVKNPPLTFRQFNDEYQKDNKNGTIARAVCVVRDFFDEIIPEGSLLGIPTNIPNPVKNSAVPAGGGRLPGSAKTYIPSRVLFLALLYGYRILDCMYEVNKALLAENNLVLSRNLFQFTNGTDKGIDTTNLLRNLKNLKGFNLNTLAKFEGTDLNFDVVPKSLFAPRMFPVKGRGQVYLLDTSPLEMIILMFETGLRGQSVQWLDTGFDCHVTAKAVVPENIYPLHVNTDKVKDCAWSAYVAGRVINLLRTRRAFRETLDDEIFEEDINYEGRPDSKWGKFKPVFSTHVQTGFPVTDRVYAKVFKELLHALQRPIDELRLNYIASTIAPVPTNKNKFVAHVDATPHSARKAVVMDRITYLPPEYIGKYITGQEPQTVGYYAWMNPEAFDLVDNHQKAYAIIDGTMRIVDTSKGPDVTEPHRQGSALRQAFSSNIEQAIRDFGATSLGIGGEERSGVDLLREGNFTDLLVEATHICLFGGKCPEERVKQGLVRRCNYCHLAVRTIDNLPAISSEIRNLEEEQRAIDAMLDKSGDRMSSAQQAVAEDRRRAITEDMFSLRVAECVLEQQRQILGAEYRQAPTFFCFAPEILVKGLEAVTFPSRSADLVKHILSRLRELSAYISLNDRTIKAKIAKFSKIYLANNKNPDEFLEEEDLDAAMAEAYSLVQNILNVHQITLDELTTELNKDISEIRSSGAARRLSMPMMSSIVGDGNSIGAPS